MDLQPALPPPEGDDVETTGQSSTAGSFERFLASAIATILTIVFSWRILLDPEPEAGRRRLEWPGEHGERLEGRSTAARQQYSARSESGQENGGATGRESIKECTVIHKTQSDRQKNNAIPVSKAGEQQGAPAMKKERSDRVTTGVLLSAPALPGRVLSANNTHTCWQQELTQGPESATVTADSTGADHHRVSDHQVRHDRTAVESAEQTIFARANTCHSAPVSTQQTIFDRSNVDSSVLGPYSTDNTVAGSVQSPRSTEVVRSLRPSLRNSKKAGEASDSRTAGNPSAIKNDSMETVGSEATTSAAALAGRLVPAAAAREEERSTPANTTENCVTFDAKLGHWKDKGVNNDNAMNRGSELTAALNRTAMQSTERNVLAELELVKEQYNRLVRHAETASPLVINKKGHRGQHVQYTSSDTDDDDDSDEASDDTDDDSNDTVGRQSTDSDSDDSLRHIMYSGYSSSEREYSLGEPLGEDSSDSEYCLVFKRVLDVITEEDSDDLNKSADTDVDVSDIHVDGDSFRQVVAGEVNGGEEKTGGEEGEGGQEDSNDYNHRSGTVAIDNAASQTASPKSNWGNTSSSSSSTDGGGNSGTEGVIGVGGAQLTPARACRPRHLAQEQMEGNGLQATDDGLRPWVRLYQPRDLRDRSRPGDGKTRDNHELNVDRGGPSVAGATTVTCADAPSIPTPNRQPKTAPQQQKQEPRQQLTQHDGPAHAVVGAREELISRLESSSLEAHNNMDSSTDSGNDNSSSEEKSQSMGRHLPSDESPERKGLVALALLGESSLDQSDTDTNSIDVPIDVNPERLAEAERHRLYGGLMTTARPVTIGPYRDRQSEFVRRSCLGLSPPHRGTDANPLLLPTNAPLPPDAELQPAASADEGKGEGEANATGDEGKHEMFADSDDNRTDKSSLYWMPEAVSHTDSNLVTDNQSRSINIVKRSSLQQQQPPTTTTMDIPSTSSSSSSHRKDVLHEDYLHGQYHTVSSVTPSLPSSTAGSTVSSRSQPRTSEDNLTDQEYDTAEEGASSSSRYRTPETWSGMDSGEEYPPPRRKTAEDTETSLTSLPRALHKLEADTKEEEDQEDCDRQENRYVTSFTWNQAETPSGRYGNVAENTWTQVRRTEVGVADGGTSVQERPVSGDSNARSYQQRLSAGEKGSSSTSTKRIDLPGSLVSDGRVTHDWGSDYKPINAADRAAAAAPTSKTTPIGGSSLNVNESDTMELEYSSRTEQQGVDGGDQMKTDGNQLADGSPKVSRSVTPCHVDWQEECGNCDWRLLPPGELSKWEELESGEYPTAKSGATYSSGGGGSGGGGLGSAEHDLTCPPLPDHHSALKNHHHLVTTTTTATGRKEVSLTHGAYSTEGHSRLYGDSLAPGPSEARGPGEPELDHSTRYVWGTPHQPGAEEDSIVESKNTAVLTLPAGRRQLEDFSNGRFFTTQNEREEGGSLPEGGGCSESQRIDQQFVDSDNNSTGHLECGGLGPCAVHTPSVTDNDSDDGEGGFGKNGGVSDRESDREKRPDDDSPSRNGTSYRNSASGGADCHDDRGDIDNWTVKTTGAASSNSDQGDYPRDRSTNPTVVDRRDDLRLSEGGGGSTEAATATGIGDSIRLESPTVDDRSLAGDDNYSSDAGLSSAAQPSPTSFTFVTTTSVETNFTFNLTPTDRPISPCGDQENKHGTSSKREGGSTDGVEGDEVISDMSERQQLLRANATMLSSDKTPHGPDTTSLTRTRYFMGTTHSGQPAEPPVEPKDYQQDDYYNHHQGDRAASRNGTEKHREPYIYVDRSEYGQQGLTDSKHGYLRGVVAADSRRPTRIIYTDNPEEPTPPPRRTAEARNTSSASSHQRQLSPGNKTSEMGNQQGVNVYDGHDVEISEPDEGRRVNNGGSQALCNRVGVPDTMGSPSEYKRGNDNVAVPVYRARGADTRGGSQYQGPSHQMAPVNSGEMLPSTGEVPLTSRNSIHQPGSYYGEDHSFVARRSRRDRPAVPHADVRYAAIKRTAEPPPEGVGPSSGLTPAPSDRPDAIDCRYGSRNQRPPTQMGVNQTKHGELDTDGYFHSDGGSPTATHGDYNAERQTLERGLYARQYPTTEGVQPDAGHYHHAQSACWGRENPNIRSLSASDRPASSDEHREAWRSGRAASVSPHRGGTPRAMISHSRTEPDLREASSSSYRGKAMPYGGQVSSSRSCTALATSTALARKDYPGPPGDRRLAQQSETGPLVSAVGNAEATGENPYIAVARATARAATIASASAAAEASRLPPWDQESSPDDSASDINVVVSTSCTIRADSPHRVESDANDVIGVMGGQGESAVIGQHRPLQSESERQALTRGDSMEGPKRMVITIEQDGRRGSREKQSKTVELELPENVHDEDLTHIINAAVKRIISSSSSSSSPSRGGLRRDMSDSQLSDIIERVTQQVMQAYSVGRSSDGRGRSAAAPMRYPLSYGGQMLNHPVNRVVNQAVPTFRTHRIDKEAYREMHRISRRQGDSELAKYAVPVNSFGHRLQHVPLLESSLVRDGKSKSKSLPTPTRKGGQSDKDQTYFYVTGTGPGGPLSSSSSAAATASAGQVDEVVLKVVTDADKRPNVEHVMLSGTESGSEAGTPLISRRQQGTLDRNGTLQNKQHITNRKPSPRQEQQHQEQRLDMPESQKHCAPKQPIHSSALRTGTSDKKIKGILRSSPRYESPPPQTTQANDWQVPSVGIGAQGPLQGQALVRSRPPTRESKPYDSVLLQPVREVRTPLQISRRYESPERQLTQQRSKVDDARKGYLQMTPSTPPWPKNTVLDAAFEEKKRRWAQMSASNGIRGASPADRMMVVDIDIDRPGGNGSPNSGKNKASSKEELRRRLSAARLQAPSSEEIDKQWQATAALKPYKSHGNLLDHSGSTPWPSSSSSRDGRERLDSTGSTTSTTPASTTTAADLRRVKSLGTLPNQFFSVRRSYTSLIETDLDTGLSTETPLIYETDLDVIRPPKARSLTNLAPTPSMVPIDIDEDRRKSMENLPAGRGGLTYSLPPAAPSEQGSDSVDSGSGVSQERSLSAGELRIAESLSKLSIPDWYKSSFGKVKPAVELPNTRKLRELSQSGDSLDRSFEGSHATSIASSRKELSPLPQPPRPVVIQHRVSGTLRAKSPCNSSPSTPVDTQPPFELPSARLKHSSVELKPVETKPVHTAPLQIPKKQSAKEAYLRLKAQSQAQGDMVGDKWTGSIERPKDVMLRNPHYKTEQSDSAVQMPGTTEESYVAKTYFSLASAPVHEGLRRQRAESAGHDSGLGPSPMHDIQTPATTNITHPSHQESRGWRSTGSTLNTSSTYEPGATCSELIEKIKLDNTEENVLVHAATVHRDPLGPTVELPGPGAKACARMLDNIDTSAREIRERAEHISTDPSVPQGIFEQEGVYDSDSFPMLTYSSSPASRRKSSRRKGAESAESKMAVAKMSRRRTPEEKARSGSSIGSDSLDHVIGGLLGIPKGEGNQEDEEKGRDYEEDREDLEENCSPKAKVFHLLRQAGTPRSSMTSMNTSRTQEPLSDYEDVTQTPEENTTPPSAENPLEKSPMKPENEETVLVKCRNPKCKKTAKLCDARRTYKTCHNCFTYYCGRDCRKAHWERHKRKCLYSRLNSLCKRIVRSIHDRAELLSDVSRVALTGYLAKGRGCVLLAFSCPEKAEAFLEGGTTALETPLGYASLDELRLEEEVFGEHLSELLDMCQGYNPDIKFVVEVAVVSGADAPTWPVPRREGPAIKKCARLRLSAIPPTRGQIRQQQETLILTAMPGSELTENMDQKKAREITFVNIQQKLRARGVNLRQQFPDVYRKLCAYVSQGEPFSPMTIYPTDSTTGRRFMCLVMPRSEHEIDWMHNPDLLEELGLVKDL